MSGLSPEAREVHAGTDDAVLGQTRPQRTFASWQLLPLGEPPDTPAQLPAQKPASRAVQTRAHVPVRLPAQRLRPAQGMAWPGAARRVRWRRCVALGMGAAVALVTIGLSSGQWLDSSRQFLADAISMDAISMDGTGDTSKYTAQLAGAGQHPPLSGAAADPPPGGLATSPTAAAVSAGVPPPPAATEPLSVSGNGTRSAAALRQQLMQAEAALRTGRLEAVLDYGNGRRSTAIVLFDRGTDAGVPRLHMTATYDGATNAPTSGRIVIGERAWELQPNGRWTVVATQESVARQLQGFLPRAISVSDSELISGPSTSVLQWYQPSTNSEVTVQLDAETSVPRQLRLLTRATGVVLTVTYNGWNAPVEIHPPTGT